MVVSDVQREKIEEMKLASRIFTVFLTIFTVFEFAVEGSAGAEDDDDDAEEVIFVEEIVAVFVKLLLLLKLLLSGLSIADFMITELLLLLLLLLLVAAVVGDDLAVTVIGEALLITVFLMAATDIGDCVCVGVKPPLEFFCKVVGDEIPLLVALRPVFAFIILLDLANTAAAVCLAKAIVFELLDFVILIDVGVAVVRVALIKSLVVSLRDMELLRSLDCSFTDEGFVCCCSPMLPTPSVLRCLGLNADKREALLPATLPPPAPNGAVDVIGILFGNEAEGAGELYIDVFGNCGNMGGKPVFIVFETAPVKLGEPLKAVLASMLKSPNADKGLLGGAPGPELGNLPNKLGLGAKGDVY
uniref:Uncharacterized protein n=1 Tax=Glossina pallidipes TaxID=7398 RepID=A0A1B0A1K8_GLOPL